MVGDANAIRWWHESPWTVGAIRGRWVLPVGEPVCGGLGVQGARGSTRLGLAVMLRSVQSPIENELEEHRRALTGYCYRMIGSGAEAEDAVQETMVRAWKSADKLQERGALKAWLFRIANNVCLDMLGSAQRRATPMDMGPSSAADSPLGAQLTDSAYVRPIADGKV